MVKKAAPKAAKKQSAKKAPMSKSQTRLLEGAMAGGFAFVIGSVFLMSSLQNFFMATNQFASVVSSVLVDLANTDRAANSLGGLTINPTLVEAAQAKADDMAAKSYFAHKSPEGLDSWHWFKEAGYDFQHAGENLAVDFSDSADVERAWMNSPSHRDNILNGKYTEIGIATASGYYQGRPTTFVVQMFGTPRRGGAIVRAEAPRPAVATQPTNPTEIATASNETPTTPVLGEQVEAPDTTPAPAPVTKPVTKPVAVASETPQAAAPVASRLEPAAQADVAQKPIGAVVRASNDWEVLVTSPSTTLRYSYYLLALLVLLALAVDTGLEIKWHHRKRATSAGLMMAMMFGLFWYADYSMFRHATVAEASEISLQTR